MLEAQEICKSWKGQSCLQEISLSIMPGERIGILGDNGSGKSTFMSILAGIDVPDKGCILYKNHPITKIDRKKIAYVPQIPMLMEQLSVRDNLFLWHGIYGLDHFKITLDTIPDFLGISDILKKKINQLSGGMKKKVSIGIALMNAPDFLILDEAFAALDCKTKEQMIQYLNDHKEMGIIYSSHQMDEIVEICKKVMVLREGVVTYQSNIEELFTEEKIAFLYSKF